MNNEQTVLHTFRCFYNGRVFDVKAKTKYEAEQIGAKHFKVKQTWKVATVLLENGDRPGQPIIHSTLD